MPSVSLPQDHAGYALLSCLVLNARVPASEVSAFFVLWILDYNIYAFISWYLGYAC